MKKILITGVVLSTIFAVTGCGNSQKSAITELENQVDMLNNTLSSVSQINTTIPSVADLNKEIDSQNYKGVYQVSKNKLDNHENLKAGIKGKTALIKKEIAKKDLQLSKANIIALNDLSCSLKKQTKELNETKSDYYYSVKNIKETIDDKNSSTSQISAKLNDYTACIENRSCCFSNILNSLNKIQEILNIQDNSFNDFNVEIDNNKDYSNDLQELLYRKMLQEENMQDNTKQMENINKIDGEKQKADNQLNNLSPNNQTPPQNMKNTNNADTYMPRRSNIDTYRPYGYNNGMRGYNNYVPNEYINSNRAISPRANTIETSVNKEKLNKSNLNKVKESYKMTLNRVDVNEKIKELIESN